MIHVGIECGEFDAMLYLTRQLDDLKTRRKKFVAEMEEAERKRQEEAIAEDKTLC
jgi:hypothetical protein